ncbi:hypothetical protein RJ55_03314 [Drechmeria coniospora]|nr:hypothetical protein RJ55_03314 [Drechmeria coniospora]
MTDMENATRAPESDAQPPPPPPPPKDLPQDEGQSTSGSELLDDVPGQAASLTGEHCITDRPTPSGQSATGEITKLDNVDVYVSKPADYPHAPARLLLLLTGGTGIRSTNNQIQADKYASAGYLVLMPDLFAGDTAPTAATITDDSTTLLEQVKIKAVEVTKSFMIDMWLARITADKVMPLLHKVIDAAKDEYADAVKHGDGMYAVGYCVGARFVLLLAKAERLGEQGDGAKKGPHIKAGALAHAASVVPDDFKDLEVPLSLICVENDPLFPDAVRSAGEEVMSTANLEHEVKVYPGVPHGFAVVGSYADSAIGEAQAAAYEQMLSWIQEH